MLLCIYDQNHIPMGKGDISRLYILIHWFIIGIGYICTENPSGKLSCTETKLPFILQTLLIPNSTTFSLHILFFLLFLTFLNKTISYRSYDQCFSQPHQPSLANCLNNIIDNLKISELSLKQINNKKQQQSKFSHLVV